MNLRKIRLNQAGRKTEPDNYQRDPDRANNQERDPGALRVNVKILYLFVSLIIINYVINYVDNNINYLYKQVLDD